LRRRNLLTCGGQGEILALLGADVEAKVLGKSTGVTAELTRGLWWLVVQRSNWSAAEQRCGEAERR
jgi:hypothetical protein